jgi:UPF0755 protein
MRISVLGIFKTVILALLLVGLGIGGYWAYNRIPTVLEKLIGKPEPAAVSPGREVVVAIPKGASLSQVATILEEKGVISSRLIFKLVAMIRGEQRKIQAGDYELRTGSDAGVVLDQLISGKTLIFPFTCPEGYNIFQVAELFEQTGKMSREEFLKTVQDKEFIKELGVDSDSLEGYLFPDTYFLRSSEKKDGKLLIRKMVKRFQEVYDKNVRPTAEEYGWTEHEVLTLASLIEKEAKGSEHPLVSAVFHNRLRKGMRLQSDPTVIYGIKPMGSPITKADLNNKHTYNTYQNSGLPPGPIANPGRASLIAAVKPADVDYLYFVAKNDGTHQFSSSLQEHNRWVNLYQRQPRELSR